MPQSFVIARIGKPFSIRGWLWLNDDGESLDSIDPLEPLILFKKDQNYSRSVTISSVIHAPKRSRILFAEISNRTDAEKWVGAELLASTTSMMPLAEGEYYWTDLIGCRVSNTQASLQGEIVNILRAPAHDLLEIKVLGGKNNILVPAVDAFIRSVDLEMRLLILDWEES